MSRGDVVAYFLVSNEEIIAAFTKYQNDHHTMRVQATKLVKSLEGSGEYLLGLRGGLLGIEFKKGKPSEHWVHYDKRRYSKMFRPRRNTKAGKELDAVFKAVPKVLRGDLDKLCGYSDWIMIGDKMYSGPGLETGKNGEVIMRVPEAVCLHEKYKKPSGVKELTIEEYANIRRKDK
jgi:hypothetical protein